MAWEDWYEDEIEERRNNRRQALVQELGEEEVLRREHEATLVPVMECVLSVYDTDGKLLSIALVRGERWEIVNYGSGLALSLLPHESDKLTYFKISSVESIGRLPRDESRLVIEPLE